MTSPTVPTRHYDVLIAGAGITGSALLYTLSAYTDIRRIALLEKYCAAGEVNSSSLKNSQTLHFGDIETNYPLEKALVVKEAAEMTARYLDRLPDGKGIFTHSSSLVLAVGNDEVAKLEARYEQGKGAYPSLQKLDREAIAAVEPNVVAGRSPDIPILALYSTRGYTVNYGKLAEQFIRDATTNQTATIDQFFETKILSLKKNGPHYSITTTQGYISAEVVVAALGAHSLLFAKSLGLGQEFFILPVLGDYYSSTRRLLNGKVYTVQKEKLPFAAIHGDPNILNPEETRFGPTARVLPILERGISRTLSEFWRTTKLDFDVIASIIKIAADKDIAGFIGRNMSYDLPLFGRKMFLKTCAKIIPTITSRDLAPHKSRGGIRPQLVHKKTGAVLHGPGEIIGNNIIFNITPSPGATASLQSAEKMAKKIMRFFNDRFHFDQEKFNADFRTSHSDS